MDTIQWTLWKRQLQRAADRRRSPASTSVATCPVRPGCQPPFSVTCRLLRRPAWPLLNPFQTPARRRRQPVRKPFCSVRPMLPSVGTARKNQVKVMLKVSRALPFSSMYMSASPIIVARATAASVGSGGQNRVIGLDTRANKTAITIGGSTTVDMGTCSLISNSAHPSAAATNVGSRAPTLWLRPLQSLQ